MKSPVSLHSNAPSDVFEPSRERGRGTPNAYSEDEVRLANRNSGILLESLRHDITPIGQHYLLIHFDVPAIETSEHRLSFGAGFNAPYDLSVDEIRAMPAETLTVTLECAGNGRRGHDDRSLSMPWGCEAVGTAEWTGVRLLPLIERAQPQADTIDIAFFGADRGFDDGVPHAFARSLTLDQLAKLDALLVYAMNGQPLLPQHGAPLRLIVPGWYGMASVKWLSRIEALSAPFQGFQQVRTYRYRQTREDDGEPVAEIRVKSLMQPPGIPDWSTRTRFLTPGPVTVRGRAWSGAGVPITKVEFGVNSNWVEASLSPRPGRYAWTRWEVTWDAKSGDHVLRCRATDANGSVQPFEPPWDVAGFGNNAVQSVSVFVGDSA